MSNHSVQSPVEERESRIKSHGFFVTGTDTGVGKTLVACALLHALAARGLRAVGMKPVAAGAEPKSGGLVSEDVEQLAAASNVAVPRSLANPYCFAPPIAPHLAAQEEGREIVLEPIVHAYRELTALADVVVVEGAGGLLVPLNAREDMADLALRLTLPVILVVGMRLGCLNHALLTAEAARARGLRLAGWVANHVDATMARAGQNAEALAARIGAPCVARIAFAELPDARRVAPGLDVDSLARAA